MLQRLEPALGAETAMGLLLAKFIDRSQIEAPVFQLSSVISTGDSTQREVNVGPTGRESPALRLQPLTCEGERLHAIKPLRLRLSSGSKPYPYGVPRLAFACNLLATS